MTRNNNTKESACRAGGEPLEKQLWKAADKLRKNIDAAAAECLFSQKNLYNNIRVNLMIFPFTGRKATRLPGAYAK